MIAHRAEGGHTDPEVIADFAAAVGNERRLTALYLLTVADIRGTSPKVWNAWKGKLLEDLYRLTLRALGGARPNLDTEIEARKLEARLLLNLAMLPGTVEVPLWGTLELSYFVRHDAGEIAWHTRSLFDHVETPKPVVRAARRRSASACRCWSTCPTSRTCSPASAATSTAPTSTSSMRRCTRRRAATRSTPSSSSARTSSRTIAT